MALVETERQELLQRSRWEIMVESISCGGSEKWDIYLKVELTALADSLPVGCEREELNKQTRTWGQSNWKDKVAITWIGEHCMSRFGGKNQDILSSKYPLCIQVVILTRWLDIQVLGFRGNVSVWAGGINLWVHLKPCKWVQGWYSEYLRTRW